MIVSLSSCEKTNVDDSFSIEKKTTFHNRKLIDQTTSKLSKTFLDFGVKTITVTENNNSLIYDFETVKNFHLNGESINFSDFRIVYENEFVFLDNGSNLKLKIVDDEIFVESDSYTGVVDKNDFFENREFNLLFFFLQELIIEDIDKIDFQDYVDQHSSQVGCSFWNTYHVFSTGFSRTVALLNLDAEIRRYEMGLDFFFNLDGCRKLGGVDVSCMTENHGCFASQAYCCNNQ